jgi:diguanylate cyclase (GGDEF)-like protein
MANIILKPVYALVKGTEKVAVGEFQHKIPVLSSDELGLLARTFNRMTFNISVLYNVSNAMNFISDSDKLLNIILDKALEALHAERGSLMLLDGEDETLMVKVIRGLDEKAAGYIKIKVGEGVAGHVAATGEPLVISSGDEDERFKKFQEWINRSRISSLLCVPLKIEDKVIGVINMVNKHEGEHFNENDIKLMMVLSSQYAVTLSKAKLYEDSITDGMTKLFIHRYFQARLDDELKRARRYKTRLSLVMFDIDHFKSFNDTYGHQQGDIVIQDCANVIRASIREHIDIAARYGGEEFAIIMPETGPEGAQVLAERLRIAIEEHEFPGQEKPLHVTVSLGISTFPEDAVEKNMIIKLADEALYAAKEAGRNNVQIYSLLPKSEG